MPQVRFMKNQAIIGGMRYLVEASSGALSVDKESRSSAEKKDAA